MRNKKTVKLLSVLFSVIMAFSMVIVSTGKAEAASGRYQVTIPSTLHVGEEGYAGVWDSKTDKELTVKSLATSNKSIVKITTYTDSKKHKYYYPVGVAKGKATLTMKYKLPGGKVKTVKKTVKVLPYPNQIKSLSVNGKTIKINKDTRYYYNAKYKKTSATIKMKLKSGWKISYASGLLYGKSGEKEIKGVQKLITKGSDISFPKKYSDLSIYILMTNGKDDIGYSIYLYR